MKLLIIGNGGREHALAYKALQSPAIEHVFVAPGNAGTHLEARCSNLRIDPMNFEALIDFCHNNDIDHTIVGPEAPLAAGIVDAFEAANLPCFGPTKLAAQLESSKTFCKDLLQKYGIPTAAYATFTDIDQALQHLTQQTFPIVIKADGLAAGKGVIIAETLDQAQLAVTDMLADNRFGAAGSRVVIEEFLAGVEASFIVMCDGEHVLPLATSQDHKRLNDNNQGPNTGGMGAFSPAPIITPELHDRIMATIIHPTIDGLLQEGIRYRGFLYAGLMISPTGEAKVLEYNCRLGDPETQPLMMRLASDFMDLIIAADQQQLNTVTADWHEQCAIGVVLASNGYPFEYPTEEIITMQLQSEAINRKIFHAGTRLHEGNIITTSGRVLCATALGDTFQQAQQNAYACLEHVHWNSMFYRNDIGCNVIDD